MKTIVLSLCLFAVAPCYCGTFTVVNSTGTNQSDGFLAWPAGVTVLPLPAETNSNYYSSLCAAWGCAFDPSKDYMFVFGSAYSVEETGSHDYKPAFLLGFGCALAWFGFGLMKRMAQRTVTHSDF